MKKLSHPVTQTLRSIYPDKSFGGIMINFEEICTGEIGLLEP
jgi:hypothetical protein